MKKQILFFAVAALALASCSSDKIAEEKQVAQQQAEPGAVLFEAYTQRGVTRAGTVGTLTTDGMKTGAFKDDGFGVFGYYTDNNTYDKLYLPNFMYNEQVKWNGSSAWTYEPVKYWPNEYGATAISDDQDKVSFFAYAPYVLVSPATGKVVNAEGDEFKQDESAELQKWGITSMTRNTATGDPLIKYLVSFDPAHSVDLCWGVCDEEVWTKVVDGGNQTFTKGKPWIDVQRPANAVDQKLKFTFKHATSQLNVQVDAFVDGTDNTNPIAAGSKVYIRSITFEGFATQGTLNLNNTDVNPNIAYWLDYAGTNDLVTGETVTIYDGRKDGKEGTNGGEATNEKVLGLNPNFVQSTVWNPSEGSAMPGVTNVAQNLFRKWNKTTKKYEAADLLEPVYIIPTGDNVKVTIAYDIETKDGNLATYLSDAETNGSSIPNVISKTINFGNSTTFENGKSYTIKLHLGLNSVKFDAAVSDWQEAGGWSHTDLPSNVPVYAASTADPSTTVTLAADQITYQFAVSGLTPNADVDLTPGNVKDGTVVTGFSVQDNTANSSGVALATATLAENKTVNKKTTGWAKVIEGSNTFKVNFEQKAAPLGLNIATGPSNGSPTIKLGYATGLTTSPWSTITSADHIKVWKNGVALTKEATATKATQFSFSTTDGTITLGANAAYGDVYTITVTAGDAPTETVTAIVGQISYGTTIVNKTRDAGKFTNPITMLGKGTVVYSTSDAGVADVDENTGEVTITGYGVATITATVTPAAGSYFSTTTATYKVYVADVAFSNGSNYVVNITKSSNPYSIVFSSLVAEGAATVVHTSGSSLQSGPTIAAGADGSGNSNEADTNGMAKVSYTTKNNNTSEPKVIVLTVTSGGNSMTITINQAAAL